MQTKIRFEISDSDYLGIHYFLCRKSGGRAVCHCLFMSVGYVERVDSIWESFLSWLFMVHCVH